MVKKWSKKPAANFDLLITGVPTSRETGRIFCEFGKPEWFDSTKTYHQIHQETTKTHDHFH